MYLEYWNLREPPFQNVPDVRFAYLCAQHYEGLARLVYLVQNRKLGGVLTGPFGVGKSMVLELLAQQVRKENLSRFVGFDYLPGKPVSLARQIIAQLVRPGEVPHLEDAMEGILFIRSRLEEFGHTVLAIDEAQMITDLEVYHFLHLLMNLTLPARAGRPPSPAFTVILAGYTEMARLISQDESIVQRLQMAWHLEPLNRDQIVEYVQHRIRVAGGDMWIFEPSAFEELQATKGIPRLINNVCDLALLLGYAAHVRAIGRDIIRQALNETSSFASHLTTPQSLPKPSTPPS